MCRFAWEHTVHRYHSNVFISLCIVFASTSLFLMHFLPLKSFATFITVMIHYKCPATSGLGDANSVLKRVYHDQHICQGPWSVLTVWPTGVCIKYTATSSYKFTKDANGDVMSEYHVSSATCASTSYYPSVYFKGGNCNGWSSSAKEYTATKLDDYRKAIPYDPARLVSSTLLRSLN